MSQKSNVVVSCQSLKSPCGHNYISITTKIKRLLDQENLLHMVYKLCNLVKNCPYRSSLKIAKNYDVTFFVAREHVMSVWEFIAQPGNKQDLLTGHVID